MIMPIETPDFDTMQDVWVQAAKVEDIASYPLKDDEVLIEYSSDGTSVRLIENLNLDTPLTRDGTSKNEQRKKTPFLLRNIWLLAAAKKEEEEYSKTSNKAQEFTKEKAEEQKKKTFEELIPKYLHDFADIFVKDGLNKLSPS
ncbi:hypothetical protein BDR05DRAFT_947210 [Suillus weaverae]|nr:hypothetical protein BDR05DRAFT_947210 [Suillus weaverae]